MKKNMSDFELIEAYIDGTLSKQEFDEFQIRLTKDKVFASQFEIRKQTEKLWKESNDYSQINKRVKHAMGENKKSKYFKPYYFAIAASIILFLSFYIIMHFLNKDDSISGSHQMAKEDNTEKIDFLKPQIKHPEAKANIRLANNISAPDSIILELLRNDKTNNIIEYKSTDKIKIKWKTKEPGNGFLYIYDVKNDCFAIKTPVRLADESFTIQKSLLNKGLFKWYLFNTEIIGSFKIID